MQASLYCSAAKAYFGAKNVVAPNATCSNVLFPFILKKIFLFYAFAF